jgi:pyrroline-5-carboxylate reductase
VENGLLNKNIGFIGSGNMAQSMIEGILTSELVSKQMVMASSVTAETRGRVENRFAISVTKDNREVAEFADILILAMKPGQYEEAIREISDIVKNDTVVVTIAAGISLDDIDSFFARKMKTVRTMPNTPSIVGEGMSAICPNELVTKEDIRDVELLFNCFGKTERLEEKVMDAIPAISGSSPAYVYMLIEAMADGGVKQGIARSQAYRLAAQAVLGAAKMVLETGIHPGELKDNVCTPGGATIEAVAELERNHFRGTILNAMERCYEKTKEMSNS